MIGRIVEGSIDELMEDVEFVRYLISEGVSISKTVFHSEHGIPTWRSWHFKDRSRNSMPEDLITHIHARIYLPGKRASEVLSRLGT